MKAGQTWDNFCEEDLGHGMGSFVCSGKCFYPSRKGVHEDQEVSDSPDWGHMSKVICQSCAGSLPHIWWVGKDVSLRLELGLVRWHVWQEWVRLSKYCWSALDMGKWLCNSWGTVGVSWIRDEKVSVDKRGFLWWWEGRVESELRWQETGGKNGTGLSPLPSGLPHCCRLIWDFPFDVPYSGGWQLCLVRVLPLEVCGSGLN